MEVMRPMDRTLAPRIVRAGAVLAAALALGLGAAQAPAAPGGVAAAATEDAVLLRWRLPDDRFPDGGFVITRRGDDAERRIELPSPLPREEAVGRGLIEPGAYDELVAAFTGAPGDEEGALARALAVLVTVSRPDYARVLGTLYEDADVRAGVRYRYRVTTASGEEVGTAEVEAGRVRPLPAPEDLQATPLAGGARVELSWVRPAEEALVAAYHVYRTDADGREERLTRDPHFVPIIREGAPARAPFNDDGVTPGATYAYSVEAIDLFGRVGPRSDPVRVTLPDPDPLPEPVIAEQTLGDERVTLRWSPVRDPRVAGIAVLRARDPDGPYRRLTREALPPDATRFVDDDVRGGQNYYYALVTIDAEGRRSSRGPAWAVLAEDRTPPPPPTDVHVDPSTRRLTLRWSPPADANVGEYRIYASRGREASPDDFAYVASTSLSFYGYHLEAGGLDELRFVVRSVNRSGVEGPPSQVAHGRLIDETPPPAPSLLEAQPGDGLVRLRWTATNDPDVAARRLYRSVDGGPFELVEADLPPEAHRYGDDQVRAGVRYRYRLDSVDASGNASPPSEELEVTPLDFAPPEPVGEVAAASRDETVVVTWRAREGERYVVERARAGAAGFVELHDPVRADRYTDPTGEPGDRYRVFAVDEERRVGPPSNPVTAR